MCSGWLKNYIFKCNENIFTNRKNLLHFTYSQKFEKKNLPHFFEVAN